MTSAAVDPRAMRHRLAPILLLLLLPACVGTTAPTAPTASDPTSTTGGEVTEDPSGRPADAGAPVDPDAAAQLAWFVAVLNEPAGVGPVIEAATYEAHFDASFRDLVPLEQFQQITAELRSAGPFTLGEVRQDGPTTVADLTAADGTELVVSLATTDDGRMDSLLIQPGEPPVLEDPPVSLEEVGERLQAIGDVTWVAARVGPDATCTTLAEVDGDRAAPIGSAFKLYVLGAVAQAVVDGTLTWDTELTITPELKSLPSGVLQTRPDGATTTVEEAAELMISISDNTATDLLIDAVGRAQVEAAQAALGHHDPSLNVPFLTTRELFALKVADADTQARWLGGDRTERLAVLQELADVSLDEIPVAAFLGDPVRPDELEWFASPTDLCRALAHLLDLAEDPGLAPVATALTANPGVPDDDERWTRVAFKGGSEPGLVTLAWLVEDADGGRWAVTGSVVDPEVAFAPTEAILLMGAGRDLLGQS